MFVVGAGERTRRANEESAVETTIETPCYLSKVATLPARIAPELFDRWCRTVAGPSPAVTVPDGDLVIDHGTLERYASPGAAYPYRRLRGRLRFRSPFVRDVDVEVELAPWSGAKSELALRCAGRRAPGVRRRARFHALGIDVLGVLTGTLAWYHAQADEVDERVIVAA
jgi:hypothetical protein